MNDDFKACWSDLGVGTLLTAPAKPYDMEGGLEEAALKATADLLEENPHIRQVTPEVLAQLIGRGAQLFVKHWLGSLQQEDLGGLIAFMVDGLHLQADELRTFVQALPESVLNKFVKSRIGQAKGTHALLALEWHRRHGRLTYNIIDQAGTPMVRIMTEKGEATFGLDEAFEG